MEKNISNAGASPKVDPLKVVLQRAEAPQAVFSGDEVRSWPQDTLEQLLTHQVIRETAPAHSVLCDACGEGHAESVVWVQEPPGSERRAYLSCPEAGRVWVPLNRLRQWEVNLPGLAVCLANLLGASHAAEEIVPARLWWLGRHSLTTQRQECFLVRGVIWPDAKTVFSSVDRLHDSPGSVVFVPGQIPNPQFFGKQTVVISVSDILLLNNRRMAIDRQKVIPSLSKKTRRAIRPVAPFPTPPNTTWFHVSIRFISNETATITAGKITETRTFAEMGFTDHRKRDRPDSLWGFLRTGFAQHQGEISWETNLEQKDRDRLKTLVKELRKRLKALFGIPEDPFEPYRRIQAYKTKFRIVDESYH